MFKRFIIGLFQISLVACSKPAPNKLDYLENIDSIIMGLKGTNVRQHMNILASDEMQGREAGTENYDKAAQYLIQNFSDLGLQPLGSGGSFKIGRAHV